MNFSLALQHLRAGALVRREGWPEGDRLRLHRDRYFAYTRDQEEYHFVPDSGSILADDWELVRTPGVFGALQESSDNTYLIFGVGDVEILRFAADGKLYYRGKLVEEAAPWLVKGLQEFLLGQQRGSDIYFEGERRTQWEHLLED